MLAWARFQELLDGGFEPGGVDHELALRCLGWDWHDIFLYIYIYISHSLPLSRIYIYIYIYVYTGMGMIYVPGSRIPGPPGSGASPAWVR